jgi:hypothetical protein
VFKINFKIEKLIAVLKKDLAQLILSNQSTKIDLNEEVSFSELASNNKAISAFDNKKSTSVNRNSLLSGSDGTSKIKKK